MDHGPSGAGTKKPKENWELLGSSNVQELSSSKVEKWEQAVISDYTWFHMLGKCSSKAIVYNSSDPSKCLCEPVITDTSQSSRGRGNKSLSTQEVTLK